MIDEKNSKNMAPRDHYILKTFIKKVGNDPELKMKVSYEWVVEHVDEHDDIQDHDNGDNLIDGHMKEPVQYALLGQSYEGRTLRLALIRDRGSEANGLDHRSYAYAYKNEAGVWVMPDETDSGHKVPDKYKRQLIRARDEHTKIK